MKKVLALLTIISFLFITPMLVKAEDDPVVTTAPITTTVPTTTAPVTTTPVVTTETPAESNDDVDIKEAQQIVTEIAEKYLGDYLDKQLIADIIAVLFGIIGYAGFFITNIKYRKYKKETTDEVKSTISKETKENLIKAFTELADETLKPLIEQNKELKDGYETIMKVLVLMQDASAKGKVALIDYLGSKTENKEIKEATEQVTQEIKNQEETKKEVTEKVSGEYENIF